jgi:hypothetical protein
MVLSVERALIMCKSNISTLLKNSKDIMEGNKEKRSDSKSGSSTIETVELDEIDLSKKVYTKIKRNSIETFNCHFLRQYNKVDFVVLIVACCVALLNSHYILLLEVNQKENSQQKGLNDIKIFNKFNFSQQFNIQTKLDKKPLTSDLTKRMCFPTKETKYFEFIIHRWIWIDLSVYAAFPFITMSCASVIILIMLRKRSFEYFNHIRNKNRRFLRKYAERLKNEKQIIYMLLVNNFYFILTLLPYCIVFGIYRGSKKESETQKLVELAVYILLYTNNAFNFLLYGITSKNYRIKLKGLFFKG